jgi:sulfhydrogenase subunit gamma (sulfur reductase)
MSLVPEPARIVEKQSYGSDIHSYRLRLVDSDARSRYAFMPGQFNMLYVPGVGEVAISIASDPEDADLEHIIRIVGRTTQVIGRLEVGGVLGMRGPYGNGWPLREVQGSDILVVTGGLGCAPVAGAIEYMLRRRNEYGSITVLHGVKKAMDLVQRGRFEAWRRQPDTRILLTTDQPDRHWRDRTGVVTELFDELAFDPGRTRVLMCGPEMMMRYAIRFLRERGVPDAYVFVSLERNMRCAVGLCGRCQIGPEFLCKDGPIFPYARIARFFEVPGR